MSKFSAEELDYLTNAKVLGRLATLEDQVVAKQDPPHGCWGTQWPDWLEWKPNRVWC